MKAPKSPKPGARTSASLPPGDQAPRSRFPEVATGFGLGLAGLLLSAKPDSHWIIHSAVWFLAIGAVATGLWNSPFGLRRWQGRILALVLAAIGCGFWETTRPRSLVVISSRDYLVAPGSPASVSVGYTNVGSITAERVRAYWHTWTSFPNTSVAWTDALPADLERTLRDELRSRRLADPSTGMSLAPGDSLFTSAPAADVATLSPRDDIVPPPALVLGLISYEDWWPLSHETWYCFVVVRSTLHPCSGFTGS